MLPAWNVVSGSTRLPLPVESRFPNAEARRGVFEYSELVEGGSTAMDIPGVL
jgi:hypothetical protein